jgi:hypothetical protein
LGLLQAGCPICRWRGEDEQVDVPPPLKIYCCWCGWPVVAASCCFLRGSVKLNSSRKLVGAEVVAWLVFELVGYGGVGWDYCNPMIRCCWWGLLVVKALRECWR